MSEDRKTDPMKPRISDGIVGSCDCLTKSPDIKYHEPGCRYRLIRERDALAALVGTIRQSLDLPLRNVADITPEAHSHEIIPAIERMKPGDAVLVRNLDGSLTVSFASDIVLCSSELVGQMVERHNESLVLRACLIDAMTALNYSDTKYARADGVWTDEAEAKCNEIIRATDPARRTRCCGAWWDSHALHECPECHKPLAHVTLGDGD